MSEKLTESEFEDRISYARVFENTEPDYPVTDEKKWVVSKGRGWPSSLENGDYIYVVIPWSGEIRFSWVPWPKTRMHHPELCKGEEVIGAGFFRLADEQITLLSNESGHYRPDGWSMDYVKTAFEYWQAPLADDLKVDDAWEVFSQ